MFRAASLKVLALLLPGLLLASAPGHAQITEIVDVTGDGLGHPLENPSNLALDSTGNLYISGNFSSNVLKVAPDGTITQIIDATGDGMGNMLFLAGPVAVDASGNVFVASELTHNLFKVTPSGAISVIADSTGDGAGNNLESPTGVAVDTFGNIFVAGSDSHNVLKITPAGQITEVIDATGDGMGSTLDSPTYLTTDASGDLYVIGGGSRNGFKITPGGVVSEIFDWKDLGIGFQNSVASIAVDSTGNVYVGTGLAALGGSAVVYKLTPDGVATEFLSQAGDGLGNECDSPRGIAVDASGNVYVACYFSLDDGAFRIQPDGSVTYILGDEGDGQGNTMDGASSIVTDGMGTVYVGNTHSDNVFKIELLQGSCQVRNGSGINPVDLACVGTPAIGEDIQLTIDTTPSVGSATLMTVAVIGFGGPTSGPLTSGGEMLVLPPWRFLFSATGDLSSGLPLIPSLLGTPFSVQGLRNEDTGWVLLNALDLVIGS